MAEELGELVDVLYPVALANKIGIVAHCLLKQEQNIRKSSDELDEAAKDAIGDLMIFLADFCNRKGYSLQDIVNETWAYVKTRDWQKDPAKGGVDSNL